MSIKVGYSKEEIVKKVCSMCYSGCGVLVHVKDGKVVEGGRWFPGKEDLNMGF